MEEVAKCASHRQWHEPSLQVTLRPRRNSQRLLRFLKTIISCVEEVATGQCGPETKPMFCKFLKLAPFQQFLVGGKKGIAEELRNCPEEITQCEE
uniref:Saposin B-type domain-containing protein n=1 Tax=Steinernema glaseri TaxID=37863 RepID=A0A1I7YTZ4_9BILA